MFNIPKQITQGDRVTWKESIYGYNPATDTLSCYIRGLSVLNVTATAVGEEWEFVINELASSSLTPGAYKVQFVIVSAIEGRVTLGVADLVVAASFENLTELDTRDEDEKELEQITIAIGKLSSGGVAEYEIGTRKVKYQDLDQLTKRQRQLRLRIARKKNGRRNVGVSFSS